MGKSYLLRNASGETVGYIQQAGKNGRCGIRRGEIQGALDLYLINDLEAIHFERIDADVRECEWSSQGAGLIGGCLVQDGKILADTGKAAKRCIQKHLSSINVNNNDKENMDKCLKIVVSEQQTPNIKYTRRRWPPNPCCLMRKS